MTVTLEPVTDLSARPCTEYLVTDENDIAAACANGSGNYILYLTDDSALDEKAVINQLRSAAGRFSYMWCDGMNCMVVRASN